MTNQEFELQCKQLLEGRTLEVNKVISKILNKEGKELEKQQASIAILAYILPELLTHGCIIRTTTNEIAEACKCKSTMVNNVLGFVGFKYDRDRVTHKEGYESKGLFERYYQYEYTDDQRTKMKRTSSVFNIVATQKLFDLLSEELGLTITVDEEELAKLHKDSKEKSYTKKVTRETVIVSITKETKVFTNAKGTKTTINYTDIDNAINELQSLKESVENDSEPVETSTSEVVEENVQEVPSTVEMEVVSEDNSTNDLYNDLDYDFDEEPETKTAKVTLPGAANLGKHGAMKANRTHTSDEPKSSTSSRDARRNMRKGFGNQQVVANDFDFDEEFVPSDSQLRNIRKQDIQQGSNRETGFGFKGNLPVNRHLLKRN